MPQAALLRVMTVTQQRQLPYCAPHTVERDYSGGKLSVMVDSYCAADGFTSLARGSGSAPYRARIALKQG